MKMEKTRNWEYTNTCTRRNTAQNLYSLKWNKQTILFQNSQMFFFASSHFVSGHFSHWVAWDCESGILNMNSNQQRANNWFEWWYQMFTLFTSSWLLGAGYHQNSDSKLPWPYYDKREPVVFFLFFENHLFIKQKENKVL